MLKYRNLTIIPTYHSNLDFVYEVRKIFYQKPPDIIAVEFPSNLKMKILEGINRLPSISLLLYFDELLKQQLYIPITPSDSLIESIRLGQEYGIPIEFIDLFVKNYNPEFQILPDSYVLNKLSLEEFYKIVKKEMKLEESAEFKYRKEISKKEKFEKEKQDEEFLLESEINSENNSRMDAQNWLQSSEEIDELRNNYMAARLNEIMNNNKDRQILVVIGLAHWERIRNLLEHNSFSEEITSFSTSVDAKLFNVLQDDLSKIMLEPPNIVFQYEIFRSRQKKVLDKLPLRNYKKIDIIKMDRFNSIKILIERAVNDYRKKYDEKISIHKLKSLFQYIRNLPLIENRITPDLFDIVLASKSIINDNFAWIVWDEGKLFPFAKEDENLETLQFYKKGILLNGKYFKLRRTIPLKIQKIKLPLKPKPKELNKGEWRTVWDNNRWNLVSYVPEDIFEENYFQHVRIRSMNLLKDENIKIHEFTSTLLDGIDFRETIRNWAYKKKIYVKEKRTIRGDVDSVVIIFNRDDYANITEEKFPHKQMWYAEHLKESDLAFYSTFPGVDLVGPGISRIQLGGVVSFYPPRNIPDIWEDKFIDKYPVGKKKADRLLLAALLFAQKPYITYVAEKKPERFFFNIASKLGMKIIYLPLDRFNPVSLRALRNLHVLAGKKTRLFAHKYIHKRRY
ncbi:MAG: hypothetical protein ACTSWX_16415 [Promethearchaeota archaeon]